MTMFGMLALGLGLLISLPAPRLAATLGNPPTVMIMRMVTPPPQPESMKTRKLLADESDVTIPVPPPVKEPPRVVPKEETPPPPKPVRKRETPPPPRVRPKPAPQPKKVVEPAPVQAAVAAEGVGDSVPAPASPGPIGHASGEEQLRNDKSDALAALLRAVARYKKYPRQARRTGAEGPTQLLVSIGADGRVSACTLQGSSGRSVLDAATERLGEKLVGLEVPVRSGKGFKVVVPVHYTLRD